MRRRLHASSRVVLKSASLPCAHKSSLLGVANKHLLLFHPGTLHRALPPETVVIDDQTRASELHGLHGKKLWLQYEGSYPGLLRSYTVIASRAGGAGTRFRGRKAIGDIALDPERDDLVELWEEVRAEKEDLAEKLNRLHIEIDRRGTCVSVKDFPPTLSLERLMQAPEIPAGIEGALIPYHVVKAMRAADEWEKKGVFIEALNGALLHPRFGVFPPTRQDYISLFSTHVPAILSSLPSPLVAEDLGSGSGILSFLLAKHGVGTVRGLDFSAPAIDSATADAKRLNFSSKVAFYHANLLEALPAEFADAPRPHLIVCNPPWIPGDSSSLIDAAVYDPEFTMLRAAFVYARRRLLPGGKLVLIFSDLAMHLGYCERTFLGVTGAQAGFKLLEKHRLPPNASLAESIEGEDQDLSYDLFKKIRQKEAVSLYVFARKNSAIPPTEAKKLEGKV